MTNKKETKWVYLRNGKVNEINKILKNKLSEKNSFIHIMINLNQIQFYLNTNDIELKNAIQECLDEIKLEIDFTKYK